MCVRNKSDADAQERLATMTSRLAAPFIWLALVLALTLPGAFAAPAHAQTPTAPPAPLKEITVATRILPPFVVKEDGKLTGFSIELWNSIARELQLPFTYSEAPNLAGLLGEVKNGRAEAGIAAISITAEREVDFDFSHPMFEAGLQIMIAGSGAKPSPLQSLLGFVTSPGLLQILMLLGALMLLPVPLVWLLERRHPEGVTRAQSGVGHWFNALWWSSSTLAGQATEMPRTPMGRVLAVVWMLIGVVFVSYFTATVTANLTVKQLEQGIQAPRDLPGKKVATVAASTGAAFLKRNDIRATEFTRIEQAYEALENGTVQAVVYDAPILLYHAAHEGRGKVQVVGTIFQAETYGILFPNDSTLRKIVNPALLKLRESGEYQAIYRKWFAAEPVDGN
jgi:polar amino acid transport system substrate-binding protein